MNRLKALYAYLCGTNFAYLLILGLVVKALISDVSFPSILLSIPILTFEAYKLYVKSKQADPVAINHEIMEEINKIKAKVNAGTLERGVKPVNTSTRGW